MDKGCFFTAAAIVLGPPSDPNALSRFGFGVQMLTLWEQMGRPGNDPIWVSRADHHLTSNERKDLTEILYKEYAQWYETEMKIRAAAEAI